MIDEDKAIPAKTQRIEFENVTIKNEVDPADKINKNKHITRTVILLLTHLIIMFDFWSVGLPMGFVIFSEILRTGKWGQFVVYVISLVFIFGSFKYLKRNLIRDSFYFIAITLLVIHWLIVGEATVNFNIQHIQSILGWASPFILTVILQVTGIFVRMFKNNVTGKFNQVLIFIVISSISIIFVDKYLNRDKSEMHFGSIKVDVIPADAQIELTGEEGEAYAMTDKNIFSDLPTGQEYKIKASKKGLKTLTLDIKVWDEIENVMINLEENDEIKMVFVKGGTFRMGQPEPKVTGVYTDNEQPVHKVTVGDFYIGKTEVTQAQYKAVIGNIPKKHVAEAGIRFSDDGIQNDYYAIIAINWYEAIDFCNKLSDMEGLEKCYLIDQITKDPNNLSENLDTLKYTVTCNFKANGYRLPTEAEWEFAARGGRSSNGYVYSGSNNADDVAFYGIGRQKQTALKKPNELGLYDMSGGVHEWCWDWYGTYPNSAQTDPMGPVTGSRRIIRGGNWGSFVENCRVTSRSSSEFLYDYQSGFRLARSSKP